MNPDQKFKDMTGWKHLGFKTASILSYASQKL